MDSRIFRERFTAYCCFCLDLGLVWINYSVMLRNRRPTLEQTMGRHWLRLIHKKYSIIISFFTSREQTHLSRNLSCSVLSLLLHMDGVPQHSPLLTTREPCPGSCSCTDACCASVAQCGEPWAGVAPRACAPLLAMERPWMQDLVDGMGCRSWRLGVAARWQHFLRRPAQVGRGCAAS
jgi:hypothetical protein